MAGKALGTILLTLRGTPFIYQGEELGMRNVSWPSIDDYQDISTINHYRFAKEMGYSEKECMEAVHHFSRDNARTPMQWTPGKNAGFSSGKPWIPVSDDYRECNVRTEGEDQDSVLNWYRKLVKLIHPDMNPATDENTELQELWQRIQLAYRQNSIKELSELEVLVRKELKSLGIEDVKVVIPDIEDKIEEIKKEMQDIVSSTPYTYRDLIEDRVTVQKKKDEILSETKSYKDYQKELNEIILKMMSGGGLSIYVK
jgi:glycosidase